MTQSPIIGLALVGLACCGVVLTGAPAHAAQGAAPDIAAGKQIYDHWCAPCHAPGPGHPGTQSLAVKYHDSKPAALEDRTDLTPQLTAYYVRQGVALMPFFRKTEIGDAQLRDLAAYLARTARP